MKKGFKKQKTFKKKIIAIGLATVMACSSITATITPPRIKASTEIIDLGNYTYQQTIHGVTYQYATQTSNRGSTLYGLQNLKIINADQLSGEVILSSHVGDDQIGHYKITGIPENSFKNNTKITSVSYPDSINTIGYDAFSGCVSLESITPFGKDTLEGLFDLSGILFTNESFENCPNIKQVILPEAARFCSNLFMNCNNLQSVKFINTGYQPDYNTLTLYQNSFTNCNKLKEVTFPSSSEAVRNFIDIGDHSFSGCNALKELSFEQDTKLGNGTFENCYNLEKLTFYKDAVIGNNSFSNSLLSFQSEKEKKVLFYNNATIGSSAFEGCTGLTTLEFHGEITAGTNTFKKISIQNLTFPQKATLGASSFDDCFKLETITFKDDVTMFDNENNTDTDVPFTNCSALKRIEFKNGTINAKLYGLSNLECLIFHKDVSSITGRLSNLPKLKEVAFWNPNVTIEMKDESQNSTFNIYGMKGSNGLSPAQVWANSNGKVSNYKSVVSNLTVNYKGKVVAGAKSEDIDLNNLEVYAYYYNEPLKAVRLEQASSKEDISGYTITLQDTIVEGANPYYITYGQEKYYGSIEGIKKAVSKIEVSTKDDKELILVEGQTVSKDKLSIIAEYNDGTTETVTDFSIEAHAIQEGKNSIQIFYGGQTGTLEVTGIKREAIAIQAVYTGERPLEDTKLNLRYVDVTLQYNDGSEETITNYNFPEFNLDQDTLALGDNTITVRAKNLETTITVTTIRKSLESISASYNNTEVVEANEVLPKNITVMAHYNNGTREELKNYELDSYVIQVGSNTITIRYEGKMTTITVNGIKRSLQTIEAAYIGDTLKAGTVLQKDSICLTGIYNDGTKEEIKNKGTLLLENATLHAGENTVILSYGGLQTTLKLFVTEEVEATVTPENTTTPPVSTPTSGVITASPVPSSTPAETTASPTPSVAPDNSSPSPQPTQTVEPVVTKEPAATNTPDNSNQNIGTLTLKTNIKNLGINQSKTDTYNIITNKTIQFTLQTKNIQRISYQFVAKKSTLKESTWETVKNNQIKIKATSKPSVLYLKYVDKNGTTTIVKTKGFLIDKTAPTINGIANKKTYKKAVTITFKDSLSGVKTALLNKKPVKSGVKVSKNGSYTLLVTDKAGNQKKVIFKIKK